MLLVKPDLMDDKLGSIYTPEGSLQAGDKPGDYLDSFIGTVAATGPGDTIETLECKDCHARRKNVLRQKFSGSRATLKGASPCECGSHEYKVVRRGHVKMQVKTGDRVVFPRRPNSPGGEFSLIVDGEKYIMLHEEQSAYAVLSA